MEKKKVTIEDALGNASSDKQQSVVLNEEREMDFRTKEAYKTLRANLEYLAMI